MNISTRLCMYFYLIILKSSIYETAVKFDIKTLSVICGLQNGLSIIKEPPKQCTALALNWTTPDTMNSVKNIKGKLPLMIILDRTLYENWVNIVNTVQNDAIDYLNDIFSYDPDMIAFENMYSNTATEIDETFSDNIVKFIKEGRVASPNMKYGIVVPVNIGIVRNNLNLKKLNAEVDFFVIKYNMYKTCSHHNHQSDMEVLQSLEDITTTVTELSGLGMAKNKMIITIQLLIQSVRDGAFIPKDPDQYSFSDVCEKQRSKKRKYCYESVENLFAKARYTLDNNMIGVYIQDCENDDVRGTCECALAYDTSLEYTGIRIIAGGRQEKEKSVDFFKCVTGNFPKIL